MKKQILIILINLILIIFLVSNTVSGTLVTEFDKAIKTDGAQELKIEGGKIVGMIQIVGTMIAVGMLSILGIKYLLGSAEQKAQYKKSLLPYIVGAVLIFGFSNITQVIYNWTEDIGKAEISQGAYGYISAGGDLTKVDTETLKKWKNNPFEYGLDQDATYIVKIKKELAARGVD